MWVIVSDTHITYAQRIVEPRDKFILILSYNYNEKVVHFIPHREVVSQAHAELQHFYVAKV